MTTAPGAPGSTPTWTSSAKDLVTTAVGGPSRVWLTLGHGIGNEIYWPSTGEPQTRDVGFLVAAGGTIHEVKRTNDYTISTPSPGVLAPTIVHHGDGWTLTLDWAVDPTRDCVVVRYTLDGAADAVYVIAAPHLGTGTSSAWADDTLHARADDGSSSLCVAASEPFTRRSVGYVGVSDGWQDLTAHGALTWSYDDAPHGNVALTAELAGRHGTIAIGFGRLAEGAETLARSSLADGFELVRDRFTAAWRRVDDEFTVPDDHRAGDVRRSAAVIACHEDRTFPGASVASLSIPWGSSRSDLGGYHLVWSRDCVLTSLGHVAVGDTAAAHRTLEWLCATQLADGSWAQNYYADGRPYWTKLQLDEVALPVVLAAALDVDVTDASVSDMVRRAVGFLTHHGPASPQDRWEENAGTNAFTISTIVAAGRWLDASEAVYAAQLADYWNERVDDWLYAEGGEYCRGRDIDGYYVRIGCTADEPTDCGRVIVKNRLDGEVERDELIALDFLALVRYGLRPPDDPRIVDTVSLVDEILAAELPTGIAYYRYNGDGYGEQADGTPFDRTGIGRPWPLLTGERGHYELQAGRDADRYLDSILAMAGPGGMLPEQVWDADDVPEHHLVRGRPTGAAMPLAWTHAEFVKLATYASRGRPIELLPAVADRYLSGARPAGPWFWRVDAPFDEAPAGRAVVIDVAEGDTVLIDGRPVDVEPLAFGRAGVTLPPSAERIEIEVRSSDGRPIRTGTVRRPSP